MSKLLILLLWIAYCYCVYHVYKVGDEALRKEAERVMKHEN